MFDAEGNLRADAFEPSAYQLLDSTRQWLSTTSRAVFLPVDVLVVLLQHGEPSTSRVVARLVRGTDDASGLAEQLASMARKIERGAPGSPQLNAAYFSLGFGGLLSDAWDWASEAGRRRIAYRDIVRVVRWRAEYQESASVRWALRQLLSPNGERIFDMTGHLLEPLFSARVLRAFQEGVHLSAVAGLPFLGTPHLIAALCSNRRSLLWRTAESAAVEPLRLRDELLRIVGQRRPEAAPFPLNRRTLTPRVVRLLVEAHERAEAAGGLVEEADVLQALLTDGGSSLELLRALGVESRLRERLAQHERTPLPRLPARGAGVVSSPGKVRQLAADRDEEAALENIGVDLTAQAREGRLPVVLGRDAELQEVINVLMRTEQRNPLLTGAPGVGKTAIASALAQAIAEERVPAPLKGMRVIELNGASLVGGTSFRGELEARITRILQEAEDDVILFMDEAHAVFAPAGSSGRPAEVPNHFKAALASGKIAVIAATTDAEYQRWFEQDPALKRRFERIHVDELPAVVTRRILSELSGAWEERYEVHIPDEAVDAAVELSMRFLPDLSQPDKAKKLLMDAAISVATARVGHLASPDEGRPTLTRRDVAAKLAAKTGIPESRILRGRSEWWRGLAERLGDRVPGHTKIVTSLTEHLLASRVGGGPSASAQGSFVFSGTATPAKEQLARALAEELFGSAQAFFKLDMGDFQDAHSLSRLLGSPPGYVGYQDEDALVSPLRRRPAQVVYLADFDLCHPQIRDRILRMLDDGEVTDMRGMRADIQHAVFVLSVDTDDQRGAIGFGEQRDESPGRSLPRELARRIERRSIEVIEFRHFDEAERDATLRTLIDEGIERARSDFESIYGVSVAVSAELVSELLASARRSDNTTRVQSLIHQRVIRPVIASLLEGGTPPAGILVEPYEAPAPPPPDHDDALAPALETER